MKRKYIVTLLLIAAATASFFGCKNGLTFFEQIDMETKLEDAVITGAVNSVVKFKTNLYACDGNIYSKSESAVRDWRKIGSPAGIIIKLAADSNNLYALALDKTLYASTDGSTWNQVATSSVGTIETIFWDGASSSPAAYLKNTSGSFYKLSGTSSPTSESAVKSIAIAKNNGNTYTASGGTVTGNNGGDLGSVSGLGEVWSLAYSAADQAVYAGTSEGLRKLPVDASGKLTGENHDPPGNWGATVKDHKAFSVLATGTDASNSALYSSTLATGPANTKVNGLWGYYYNRRDNWNRE